MPTKKVKKPTNNEKAAARIESLLKRGIVIHVSGALADYTIGPYRRAIGASNFVIIGYGSSPRIPASHRHAEFDTAAETAAYAVAWVGSGRAREAAIAAEKKAARKY